MAKPDFTPITHKEDEINENLLRLRLGDKIARIVHDSGQPVLDVARENLVEVARTLRDEPELSYNYFTDITAADLYQRPDFEPERRFQVMVTLYSLTHKRRIRLRVFVPESDPKCPSLTAIFSGANITEREAHEMFGITFEGHPNLIRLLTPEYMKDYPLRKEYPVTGKGERDNFPQYEEIQ